MNDGSMKERNKEKDRKRGEREREREKERENEKHIVDVTQSYVCRGLWANGMQVSGGDGGSLPTRRAPGSIGISIFMGLSRLRATVPRGT